MNKHDIVKHIAEYFQNNHPVVINIAIVAFFIKTLPELVKSIKSVFASIFTRGKKISLHDEMKLIDLVCAKKITKTDEYKIKLILKEYKINFPVSILKVLLAYRIHTNTKKCQERKNNIDFIDFLRNYRLFEKKDDSITLSRKKTSRIFLLGSFFIILSSCILYRLYIFCSIILLMLYAHINKWQELISNPLLIVLFFYCFIALLSIYFISVWVVELYSIPKAICAYKKLVKFHYAQSCKNIKPKNYFFKIKWRTISKKILPFK